MGLLNPHHPGLDTTTTPYKQVTECVTVKRHGGSGDEEEEEKEARQSKAQAAAAAAAVPSLEAVTELMMKEVQRVTGKADLDVVRRHLRGMGTLCVVCVCAYCVCVPGSVCVAICVCVCVVSSV